MTTPATGHWSEQLERLGACCDAVDWARGYDTPEAAWAACGRGDWMLWVAARAVQPGSPEHNAVVAATCACARRSLPYVSSAAYSAAAYVASCAAELRAMAGIVRSTLPMPNLEML